MPASSPQVQTAKHSEKLQASVSILNVKVQHNQKTTEQVWLFCKSCKGETLFAVKEHGSTGQICIKFGSEETTRLLEQYPLDKHNPSGDVIKMTIKTSAY